MGKPLIFDELGNIKSDIADNTSQLSQIAKKMSNDFMYRDITNGYTRINAINSGFSGVSDGENKHPGILKISSSATPDSGAYVQTATTGMKVDGGEKQTFIFKTPTDLLTVLVRMGLLDTNNASAPADGVYCKIDEDSGSYYLSGHTVDATVLSTTASRYELTADSWYRLVIEINSDASIVTFKLYADDSETLLWSDTLNTNIPTGLLGQGVVATSSGTTSITLLNLDYMDLILPNSRRLS